MAVLYVDDDATICWLMAREWKNAFPGVPVHTASAPLEALAKVEQLGEALQAVVADWRLIGTTSRGLVEELRVRRPALCIIATSAALDSRQIEAAREAGADDFVEKDLSMPVFVRRLGNVIEQNIGKRGGEKR